MKELWRDSSGRIQTEAQWFKELKGRQIESDWGTYREKNLSSLHLDDIRFVLGLGMIIVLGQTGKKFPLQGILWKGRDYKPPKEEAILRHLRKNHGNIAGEMGRSNMIMLDLDRKEAKKDDWLFSFIGKTLTNISPHGYHLFFWNDVFRIRLWKKSDHEGKPLPVIESEWLKNWKIENPGMWDSLKSDYDISRIRNEIAWLPPSETEAGAYHWMEPRTPLMLFSELLISLSKGRR